MPHQAISTHIAQIYKSTYGRGPTKIATYLLLDVVLIVLEDLNTPAQDTLTELGDYDIVEAAHQRLHQAMVPQMTTAIEQVLGRSVRDCVPGFNVGAGAATNTFLLAPQDDDDRPAAPPAS